MVNIKKIPGIGALSFDPQAGLRIGALVTARALEVSEVIREKYPSLLQPSVSSARSRCATAPPSSATCRASPSADTLPPLIADGAMVSIHGGQGRRSLLLEDFFTGPGKTVLKPDELMTEIVVPAPAAAQRQDLHQARPAQGDGACHRRCRRHFDGGFGRKNRARAVAPTPIRAKKAEALLRGRKIDSALIERAAQAAVEESRPISNVRASAEYRREMVRVLTRRALTQAMDSIR